MAHFRGTIKGQRGPASRLGSVKSGLTVTANGWGFGVTVVLREKDGRDVADIFLTHGSNDPSPAKDLGRFTVTDLPGRNLLKAG